MLSFHLLTYLSEMMAKKNHNNLAHSKLLLPLRVLVGRHLQVRHLHVDLLGRRHLRVILSLCLYLYLLHLLRMPAASCSRSRFFLLATHALVSGMLGLPNRQMSGHWCIVPILPFVTAAHSGKPLWCQEGDWNLEHPSVFSIASSVYLFQIPRSEAPDGWGV